MKSDKKIIKEIYLEGSVLPIMMIYPYSNKSKQHLKEAVRHRLLCLNETRKVIRVD